MGSFDLFKKKATKSNYTYESKENNIQASPAKTEKQPCANDKPSFLKKRCCTHCGYNLDLLEPAQIIEEDGKMYCDICIKNLRSEKECALSVGTSITLKNEPICTPDMGGYPVNINQRLIVRANDYLIVTITRDANGDETYHEKIIERGFFAKHSTTEISIRLGLHNVQNNYKLLKLIEYDKTISGQSL